MKNISIVIPARMDSSRFPGKPNEENKWYSNDWSLLLQSQHEQIKNSVYVATCDKEISDYIKSIGGNVIRHPIIIKEPLKELVKQ